MIDSQDIKILIILKENGRIKRNESGNAVGLSIPSICERLIKFETKGIFDGYHARVNKKPSAI